MSGGKMVKNTMNEGRSDAGSDTQVTRGRSGPVRCEIVDRDGRVHGTFHTLIEANAYVRKHFPDQEQDEDRTDKGWDVQDAGCEP
jgi:hypothetical protein